MRKYICIIFLLCALNTSAVHLNPQGLGEVLLVPYYTVNNDLNTLVTVTNTKDTGKALKINVREGLNGHAVLSYNVYLDAFDTWSFVFVSTTSTISGSEGQDSAYQISSDTSCAPFLNKQRQEFLPYELLDGPSDLSRSREGFIEIIEMGELTGDAATFADQGNVGIPDDCAGLEAAWQSGGTWDTASGGNPDENLAPVTGGLMVEANIINVTQGINFPIPAVTLAGFFAGNTIAHTDPGDISLSLDAAEPKATVVTNDKTYQLAFESGIDAISAVLMADKLIGTFALEAGLAGKTEAVFVQPTRRFYIEDQGNNNLPPYNQTSQSLNLWCPREEGSDEFSQYGGTVVTPSFSNRESYFDDPFNPSLADPPPPRSRRAICDSVSVWQFLPIDSPTNAFNTPAITGSNNHRSLVPLSLGIGENGFFQIQFRFTRPLVGTDINTNQTVQLMGLPVIGITLHQVTNAGAAEGLLAQYGGTQSIKSTMRVIELNQ